MKLTRRKLRRVGKWAGLVFVCAMLGLGVASRWFQFEVRCDQACVAMYAGAVEVCVANRGLRDLYRTHRMFSARTFHWYVWTPGYGFFSDVGIDAFCVIVPVWLIALVVGALTAWLWYRDWNRPTRCADCGYDLTGLPAGAVCPECGKSRSASS